MLVLAAVTFFSTGKSGGVTLPAGTILHTRLDNTLNTAATAVGQYFAFRVLEPYPRNARRLAGARISAYVTDVTRPGGGRRARIGFVFGRIVFANGVAEAIGAYVNDFSFVRREPADFAPSATAMAFPNVTNAPVMLGGRPQSRTLLEVDIGPKPARPTGGYAYADRAGMELLLPENRAYDVELARGLRLP